MNFLKSFLVILIIFNFNSLKADETKLQNKIAKNLRLKMSKIDISKSTGKFTLEDLDTPPPGWTECVTNTKGNPAFPQGYQGVEYKNLARVEEPKPIEEKVEITNPKDFQKYDF